MADAANQLLPITYTTYSGPSRLIVIIFHRAVIRVPVAVQIFGAKPHLCI